SAVLRFVLQGEDPTLDALASRLTALESGEPPAPRQEAPPREAAPPPEPVAAVASEPLREPDGAAAPVAPKELSLNKIRSLWQSIRMRAEGEKGSLRAGLSRATVAALDGDVLTLRVPDPPAGEVLRRDAATVKKAIAEVTGRNLDVRIVLGAGVPPASGGGDTGLADTGGEGSDDLMRYALEKLS
ncbi:MAG TPA: hypothetical protein VIW69_06705, partial [Candidatus Elarobacter sp.]